MFLIHQFRRQEVLLFLNSKAVTWPVALVVTLSTAVKVPPTPGESEETVSDLVVASWFIVSVFVLAAYAVVKYVSPAKVTVSPLAIVSLFVPSDMFQSYIPLIADQVLSPLRYLVASGVPVALKSAVTVTAPSVAAFGVKSIKVPSVVVIVSTIFVGTAFVSIIAPELVTDKFLAAVPVNVF